MAFQLRAPIPWLRRHQQGARRQDQDLWSQRRCLSHREKVRLRLRHRTAGEEEERGGFLKRPQERRPHKARGEPPAKRCDAPAPDRNRGEWRSPFHHTTSRSQELYGSSALARSFLADRLPLRENDCAAENVGTPRQLGITIHRNAPIAPTFRISPGFQQIELLLLREAHPDIWPDADLMNDLASGGEIFCRCQAQSRSIRQGDNDLHGPFAESCLPDNDGAI